MTQPKAPAQSAMIELGVNIDHVATVRQTRGTPYPSPLQAALLAELAGADAITLHPREDRRHIQPRDVELVREAMATRMNLELAVSDANLAFAERIKPYCVLFVPENRRELTTEGGLDIRARLDRVRPACERMAAAGIRVSLFVDADAAQLEAARETGAPMVEIHTGHYADAAPGEASARELERIRAAVVHARTLGLEVNAGHGLNYHNVQAIAEIPGVRELNIGHAIVAHAIFVGWSAAVSEMKRLMREAAGRA